MNELPSGAICVFYMQLLITFYQNQMFGMLLQNVFQVNHIHLIKDLSNVPSVKHVYVVKPSTFTSTKSPLSGVVLQPAKPTTMLNVK